MVTELKRMSELSCGSEIPVWVGEMLEGLPQYPPKMLPLGLAHQGCKGGSSQHRWDLVSCSPRAETGGRERWER